MKITVFGRGNLGGGLGDLWERAGHEVTKFGRDGGNVSHADVVVIAVPGGVVVEALTMLAGLEGKAVIDATNRFGIDPPIGFASNAEYVKSVSHGPTAKAFNTNFASLFGQLEKARARPSNLWCGDEDVREIVEILNRDAGYEPLKIGSIERAAAQERFIEVVFAVSDTMGPCAYRFSAVDQM